MNTNESLNTTKVEDQAKAPPYSNGNDNQNSPIFMWTYGLIIIALAIFVFNLKNKVNDLSAELSMRPPVIVIDYTNIVKSLPDSTPETTEKALLATKELLTKLKDAGYVVLNSQSVATAPDDNFVPSSLINEYIK